MQDSAEPPAVHYLALFLPRPCKSKVSSESWACLGLLDIRVGVLLHLAIANITLSAQSLTGKDSNATVFALFTSDNKP